MAYSNHTYRHISRLHIFYKSIYHLKYRYYHTSPVPNDHADTTTLSIHNPNCDYTNIASSQEQSEIGMIQLPNDFIKSNTLPLFTANTT